MEVLQRSLRYLKRVNKSLQEKVGTLSAALEETRSIVYQRNVEIKELKKSLKSHELMIEMLQDELAEMHEVICKEHTKHNEEVEDLATQIMQLQERHKIPTFSSQKYTPNVRELYYILLSMCMPPAQIKAIVRNVVSHLVPFLKADELRLPGKSCAACMRSQEMPTISRAQKASELMQAKEWHLSSDGTTLQQQKKVAFLINGIQDVPDGYSQVGCPKG